MPTVARAWPAGAWSRCWRCGSGGLGSSRATGEAPSRRGRPASGSRRLTRRDARASKRLCEVSEVASEAGVSRQSVHTWLARYREAGWPGWRIARSGRGRARIRPRARWRRACELRRAHPKWGAQRIVHELMRCPVAPEPLPSRATVYRILVRHELVVGRALRRKRSDYVRWQRPAAMQLWQLDIVYGPKLVDIGTGEAARGADRDRRR
jgi:hypothetical protein